MYRSRLTADRSRGHSATVRDGQRLTSPVDDPPRGDCVALAHGSAVGVVDRAVCVLVAHLEGVLDEQHFLIAIAGLRERNRLERA